MITLEEKEVPNFFVFINGLAWSHFPTLWLSDPCAFGTGFALLLWRSANIVYYQSHLLLFFTSIIFQWFSCLKTKTLWTILSSNTHCFFLEAQCCYYLSTLLTITKSMLPLNCFVSPIWIWVSCLHLIPLDEASLNLPGFLTINVTFFLNVFMSFSSGFGIGAADSDEQLKQNQGWVS